MSEEKTKSHEEKVVDDHRQMLVLSGNLSTFQLENMKKWGFVLFGADLKQAKIDYNFTLKESEIDLEAGRSLSAGSVTYSFQFNKTPTDEYMAKSMQMLGVWIKFMFWNDTELIVNVEGKKWEA